MTDKKRKPSLKLILLFGLVAIIVIITLCRLLGLPMFVELALVAAAGYWANDIVRWFEDWL